MPRREHLPVQQRRIAWLVNPAADGGRARRRIARVKSLATDGDLVDAPESEEALRAFLSRARDTGIDRLAVAGGDGTVHRVVSALRATHGEGPMPMLGLLGGGTMNTIASSLGLRSRSMPAVARSLRTTPDDGGLVRPTIACGGRLGFILGIGVIPTFLDIYYGTGEPSFPTAARVLATAIAESAVDGPTWKRLREQRECAVTFDDGTTLGPRKMLAVAAGTVRDIGLGFKPFRRALESEDAMHFLAIHTDAGGFVRDLPRLWLAKPMQREKATDRLSRGFTISTEPMPLAYILDGDPYTQESGPLEVRVGPRVRFAVPSPTLKRGGAT